MTWQKSQGGILKQKLKIFTEKNLGLSLGWNGALSNQWAPPRVVAEPGPLSFVKTTHWTCCAVNSNFPGTLPSGGIVDMGSDQRPDAQTVP